MPLSVLSHREAQFPPGSPDEAVEKVWTQLQVELAMLVPGAHHVIAASSDHDIAGSQPQLVIDEVSAVVRAVRAGRTRLTST